MRKNNRHIILTDEEVIILHHLMITEMGKKESFLPECTYDSECTSCVLMDKMYELWKEVQDGDVS